MKIFESEAFRFVLILGVCIVISFVFVGFFVASLSSLEGDFAKSNNRQVQNNSLL